METVVYFTSLAAGAYWIVQILNASNLEKLFQTKSYLANQVSICCIGIRFCTSNG